MSNETNKSGVLPTQDEMFEALLPIMNKYNLYGVVVAVLNEKKLQSYKYDRLPPDTTHEVTREFFTEILQAVLDQQKTIDMSVVQYSYKEKVDE